MILVLQGGQAAPPSMSKYWHKEHSVLSILFPAKHTLALCLQIYEFLTDSRNFKTRRKIVLPSTGIFGYCKKGAGVAKGPLSETLPSQINAREGNYWKM